MALEKRWSAVAPRSLTSDGTANGILTIANSRGLRVKQILSLQSDTEDKIKVQIQNVISDTQIEVSEVNGKITERLDVSGYTLSDNAFISAEIQPRPPIPIQEHERAVYEEEPVVAKRVYLVDEFGNPYLTDNPFPVQLTDGSINIETLNAQLEVHLNDQGADYDSVRIGDGSDLLAINPDGSINVVGSISVSNAETPTIINKVVISANTEETVTFPVGTKRFALMPRTPTKMQIAYASGETNSNYISVRPGKCYEEKNVNISMGLTLYFETSKPNVTIEILYWI